MNSEEAITIITNALEAQKSMWHDGGSKNWDYEIRRCEYGYNCIDFEIWMGTTHKVCVYRKSVWEIFDTRAFWKQVLTEIIVNGVYHMYEYTVTLYREGMLKDDFGIEYGKNPLTPGECKRGDKV